MAAQVGEAIRLKHLLSDTAHAAMLLGAAAAISTAGSPGGANAALAFLGFFLWLLGVCLLSLVPVADRFPQAALVVGATMAAANAVLKHCFGLWN